MVGRARSHWRDWLIVLFGLSLARCGNESDPPSDDAASAGGEAAGSGAEGTTPASGAGGVAGQAGDLTEPTGGASASGGRGDGGSPGGTGGSIGGSAGSGATSGRAGSGGSLGGSGGAGGGGSGGGGARGGSSARGGAGGVAGLTGSGGSLGGSGGGGSGGTVAGAAGSGGETAGAGGTGGSSGSGGATGGDSGQDCPDSADYVGDAAWPHVLVVTDGAEYCGHFDEARNLEQEYATKAKIRIAAGAYPLAAQDGTYDFALPVCFEVSPGVAGPSFAGTGEVETRYTLNTSNGFVSYAHVFTQPLSFPGADTWTFQGHISYWDMQGAPVEPVFAGGPLDHYDEQIGDSANLQLCKSPECDQWDDVNFDACHPDYPLHAHTVTFDGGQIALDVRITGQVGVSAMLSAFTNASGTLDGTAFTQTDYFKLVYSADHHHFIRDFAVLFDEPIGDACGLKVLGFVWTLSELPEVYTIHCDLSDLAPRSVTDASLDLP